MNNYSYITVLSTEKYLKGALALAESLKQVKAKYPFTILITCDISKEDEDKIKSHDMQIIKKSNIKLPETIKTKNDKGNFSHWTNTFDKLLLFELTEFEKLVYLDSDMYVRQNIDELFEKKHLSATIDRRYGPSVSKEWTKLTSGLMVIEPKQNVLPNFYEIINKIIDKKDSIGDQDIIQEYDKTWDIKEELHLDVGYNLFFPHIDYYITYNNYKLEDIKVVHFIYTNKPSFIKKEQMEEYMSYVNKIKGDNYAKSGFQYQKDCILCGDKYERIVLNEYFNILDKIN